MLKKDESLRYLTFRLDFNEYYSKKKTTGILDLEELKNMELTIICSKIKHNNNSNNHFK